MNSIAYGIVADIFFTRYSLLEFNCVFLKYMFHCMYRYIHGVHFSISVYEYEYSYVLYMGHLGVLYRYGQEQ